MRKRSQTQSIGKTETTTEILSQHLTWVAPNPTLYFLSHAGQQLPLTSFWAFATQVEVQAKITSNQTIPDRIDLWSENFQTTVQIFMLKDNVIRDHFCMGTSNSVFSRYLHSRYRFEEGIYYPDIIHNFLTLKRCLYFPSIISAVIWRLLEPEPPKCGRICLSDGQHVPQHRFRSRPDKQSHQYQNQQSRLEV